MALTRSPLGGLLNVPQGGLARECCCDGCCCPGENPALSELLWSVTSNCGLSGDLGQLSHDQQPCPGLAGVWVSVSESLGTCDGGLSPIPVQFYLTCTLDYFDQPLCKRYRLLVSYGNSGCVDAQTGPFEPEDGCDCNPFDLVFKVPCPYGQYASCQCPTGTMTVHVTRVN